MLLESNQIVAHHRGSDCAISQEPVPHAWYIRLAGMNVLLDMRSALPDPVTEMKDGHQPRNASQNEVPFHHQQQCIDLQGKAAGLQDASHSTSHQSSASVPASSDMKEPSRSSTSGMTLRGLLGTGRRMAMSFMGRMQVII